ncbi:hypothetical protein GL50803_0094143 [Giardia duodenalis]|uniref:Uncharacterized protein n=1 Tax=Giardia intestinalis (strain ATCC 50803 / WB clone C6) TaxID=184922 RepID=A0A644EYQ3_GIAIC|nr:hypothetical protein GL50803_0094143 [Giardia intestinalis]KAE8301471.1 hypothetical protein GL50803_0094143 [Giardia intestinalis]
MTQRGMFLFVFVFFASLNFLLSVLFAVMTKGLFSQAKKWNQFIFMRITTHNAPQSLSSLGYTVHPIRPGLEIPLTSKQLVLASFSLCIVLVCIYVAVGIPQEPRKRVLACLPLLLVSTATAMALAVLFMVLLFVAEVTL